MKDFNIQNPSEEVLLSAQNELRKIIESYENYCADKFSIHAVRRDSMFYTLLHRRSSSDERKALISLTRYFRKLCKEAGEVCPRYILDAFKSSLRTYLHLAFQQHLQVYSSEMMKTRSENFSASLASRLFAKVAKAKEKALSKKGSLDNPVISVGKRSYHLNNYVQLVADYEAREKFWHNELRQAKKKGAIGFQVINNKPQCKNCAALAGSKFYFSQDFSGVRLLPLHPGCKCILKAIYDEHIDV